MEVAIGTQDHWTPIPGIDDPTPGHLHFDVLDLPTEPVSGVVVIHVRITAHDNLAHLNLMKFQTDDWGQFVDHVDFDLANDQPFDYTFTIDTRRFKYDGWRLGRFYAQAEHANGNLQVARPILPFEVRNGKPAKNAGGYTEWKPTAWYKEASPVRDWGYAQAAIRRADLPLSGPVPADWAPWLRFARNDKGGSPAVSGWEVRIDPDLHAGIDGLIVKTGTAAWKGNVPIPVAQLAPGPHRLMLMTHQASGDKRHGAIAVYRFEVAA